MTNKNMNAAQTGSIRKKHTNVLITPLSKKTKKYVGTKDTIQKHKCVKTLR